MWGYPTLLILWSINFKFSNSFCVFDKVDFLYVICFIWIFSAFKFLLNFRWWFLRRYILDLTITLVDFNFWHVQFLDINFQQVESSCSVCITTQKMKFPLRISSVNVAKSAVPIWSHLLKKSLMENFIFCAVTANTMLAAWLIASSAYRVCLREILDSTVLWFLRFWRTIRYNISPASHWKVTTEKFETSKVNATESMKVENRQEIYRQLKLETRSMIIHIFAVYYVFVQVQLKGNK